MTLFDYLNVYMYSYIANLAYARMAYQYIFALMIEQLTDTEYHNI
jgi:hypothetical protein